MAGYADHEYAVNFITGAHVNLPEFMADVHPLQMSPMPRPTSIDCARPRRSWGRSRPASLSEAAGILPTDRGLAIAAWQMRNQLNRPDHPLVTDFEGRLGSLDLPEDERDRLVDAVREAVDTEVVPAYRNLLEAVESASTRPDSQPGVLHHPDGDEYYAAALRTTPRPR